MIPCLYDISETAYTTNGIGKLADCISCVVTEKRNGSYELAMEYPADGIHADSITEGCIILAKPADNKSPQPFRIYKITTPLDGMMEIAARHISYQLNFITVSPTTVLSGTDDQVNAVFQELVHNAGSECPFSFETDIESEAYFGILEPVSFRNALGGVDGSMLDTYGGEFEWDFYTVCLWASRGADNGVRIVYGKNLVDFKMEKSIEDTITGVHPYWKDSESGDVVELSEKVVTLDDTDYPYEKITVLDCSSEFEEQPDEDELRSYAESYLKSTSYTEPSIDIEIDFAQLWQTPGYEDIAEAERVSLCDTVHVYISKLGIEATATVTETEYDTLLERYKSITLSNSSLSSRNNSLSNTLATTSQVEKAVSASSSAIVLTVGTNYTRKDQIRSTFAMDETSITIKSGVITFTANTISIDSDNFKLSEAGEVDAKGAFTSGSDTSYKMEMSGGQITGYYQGTEVGTITMAASHAWTIDGGETKTYRGVSIESEDIKLEGTLVDINADYFNVNYDTSSYYYGASGTITFIYDWEWSDHKLVGDLDIDFDDMSASWTNYSFSTISKIYYKTIRFHKGLMVTGLGS